MKQQTKFKQAEIGKLSETKTQEFKDKMENFKYLRQNRVSYWQAIAIIFGTSALILLVDLISKEDVGFKLGIIIFLFVLANLAYMQSLRQTQKPIFVCENAIGTIEKMNVVKEKDGTEYAVFKMSDCIHKKE